MRYTILTNKRKPSMPVQDYRALLRKLESCTSDTYRTQSEAQKAIDNLPEDVRQIVYKIVPCMVGFS